MDDKNTALIDYHKLAKAIQILLLVYVANNVAAMLCHLYYNYLRGQLYHPDDLITLGCVPPCSDFLLFVILSALVLQWTYLASYNAWRINPSRMRYSPERSVLCYFIPVGNLWMPYCAMKNIWIGSMRSDDYQDSAFLPILAFWWALWILSFVRLLPIIHIRGPYLDLPYCYQGWYDALLEGIDVALGIVFLLIIRKISQMQLFHVRNQMDPDRMDECSPEFT